MSESETAAHIWFVNKYRRVPDPATDRKEFEAYKEGYEKGKQDNERANQESLRRW